MTPSLKIPDVLPITDAYTRRLVTAEQAVRGDATATKTATSMLKEYAVILALQHERAQRPPSSVHADVSL